MKIGDVVTITTNCSRFFKAGDKAKIIRKGSDGSWWGDFNGQGNAYVLGGGIWCFAEHSVRQADFGPTAKLTITCATCPATLDLYYSHESLAARTLAEDIKHDATIASDFYFLDGLFYCDACAETQEDTREEQAMQAQAEDNDQCKQC